MTGFREAGGMCARQLRALWRQPWYVAVTLAQPLMWLLLFGALFKRVVDLPGFGDSSYTDYLAPGIVVMTAIMSAGWNGMAMLQDLERGVLDRFLVSPVGRWPILAGPLAQAAAVVAVQSAIILALSALVGASFAGGAVGLVVLVAAGVLLGTAVAALSNAVALVARRAVIGRLGLLAALAALCALLAVRAFRAYQRTV